MPEIVQCCISEKEVLLRGDIRPGSGFDLSGNPDILSIRVHKDVSHCMWRITCKVRDMKGKAVEDWLQHRLFLRSRPDSGELRHYEFVASPSVIHHVCGAMSSGAMRLALDNMPGIMWADVRRIGRHNVIFVGHVDVTQGSGEDALRKLQKEGFKFNPHIPFPWSNEWRTSD